ncbi:MAG: zinc-binding dehydrogenase [Kiritimatiellae bacterium]|nr:zinc-binding dehydrogenase [Kiritimatiellia bacterium]
MRAAAVVFEGPREVAFREVEVPEPGPSEVVVRTRYSLISNGTESSFLRGERVAGDTPARRGDKLPFPQVSGYQKVGVVEQAAENGGQLKPGQWVFVAASRISPPMAAHGGHVAVAVADVESVYPLPAGLDPIEASGLVLTQVGYNCGMRPAVEPGDGAVVIGDGLVGLWAAQTLQHRGARVALVGKHRYRYQRFKPRAGDAIIDASATPALRDALGAVFADGIFVFVDTVGNNEVVQQCFSLFRRNAHLVSAGFLGTKGAIDIQMLRNRETTLHTPSGWQPERMEATLAWLASGALQVSPLITHRMPAANAPDAFRMILEKKEAFLGVLLEW